jgi:hypothetical protein
MKTEEGLKLVGVYVAALLAVWGAATVVSDVISDVAVFEPRVGVECVVVSRAFNTSVDCYRIAEDTGR